MGRRTLVFVLMAVAITAVSATTLLLIEHRSDQALLLTQKLGPARDSAQYLWDKAFLAGNDTLLIMALLGTIEKHKLFGKKEWTYTPNNDPVGSYNSVCANGTVYFGGFSGEVICLNPDGKERWRRKLTGGKQRNYTSTAASGDERVYVAVDGFLYALDDQGQTVWQVEDAALSGSGAPYITPDGNTIIGRNIHSELFAYDLSGQPLWQNLAGIDSIFPARFNSRGEMILLDPNGKVSILDCRSGMLSTSFSLGGKTHSPLEVLSDDSVCCVMSRSGTKDNLVCFDSTGKRRFSRPVRGSVTPSRILADSRDGLFVLEPGEERSKPLSYIPGLQYSNAKLVRLDNQGKELASVNLPFMSAFTNMLQRADGSVLVYGTDGILYCYDL